MARHFHGNKRVYDSMLQTGGDLPSGVSFICVRLGKVEWEEKGRLSGVHEDYLFAASKKTF